MACCRPPCGWRQIGCEATRSGVRRDGRPDELWAELAPDEFIRRFLLHVLPKGFHRIRHYGLLASATCKTNIPRARELIAAPTLVVDPPVEHDDADPAACV